MDWQSWPCLNCRALTLTRVCCRWDAGKDKMCCGSDYPFPLGELIGGKKYAAGKIIDDAEEFDEEDKEQMLVRGGGM